MTKFLNIKTVIGILLIVAGLVLYKPVLTVDKDLINLNIEKPSAQVLELIQPISSLITDPTDRAKLAIFNQEFSKRIINYSADIQQINDVYVLAASEFFKDTLKDKYAELDVKLVSLISGVTSEDNHKLSQEELTKLSDYFNGLSWSLIHNQS
jgi:hypothetical protein